MSFGVKGLIMMAQIVDGKVGLLYEYSAVREGVGW
jgi:hypothetical protein